MGKKTKNKTPTTKKEKVPKTYSPEALALFRELWEIKMPTIPKIKRPRTKEETFKLLEEGKLKLKGKPNRLVIVDYETEGTDDAQLREKQRYVKDDIRPGPIKKRKIKKEFVVIKGSDRKWGLKYWKYQLKEKPKRKAKAYETPRFCKPVLGNDPYRMAEAVRLNSAHDLRYSSDSEPGVYDRMPDEFLSLFDADVRNENGKKRRYTAIESLDLDADVACKFAEPFRTPILKRLRKFEKERKEMKLKKPMNENEKQKYVRRYKADEAKIKCLSILQQYLADQLKKGEPEVIENEAALYKKKLNEFQEVVSIILQKIMKKMDHYKETVLKREIDDALNMRRKMLEEKLEMSAAFKDEELQHGYQQLIMPMKLMEQKESYQLDMSSYIQYWAKKVREIEKRVEVQSRYLRKHKETKRILQAAEHIPAIKAEFAKKSKEAEEESKLLIQAAMQPLKKKVDLLENVRKNNQTLIDSIKDYIIIIPEFIKKLKDFVKYTKVECPQRKSFLGAIDNVEAFRQELLTQRDEFTNPTASESSSSKAFLSRTVSDMSFFEQVEEESEMAFDLSHRFLSDGDLEECAKQLLKVKFIVTDLLKRIIASPESKQSEVYTIEGIKDLGTVTNVIQTGDETYIEKLKQESDSYCILDKLQKINKKLDVAFAIVGDKYSKPDIIKAGAYLKKRTASVDKMLKKNQFILKNIM